MARFSEAEIIKANNVGILDYINSLGLDVKKVGKTLKIEGHGGLYINPIANKWNCFSERKGGGPIQLAMYLENTSWVNAVKKLLGNNYENHNTYKTNSYKNDIEKENQKGFMLPKKNSTYKHMIAYLTKSRGISMDIIQKFIDNKMLYEDEKRNCVFVGYDENKIPRYAGLRGTNTQVPFKGETKNSDKAYSFNLTNKNSNKLLVFESPIEVMSYLTLYKLQSDKEFSHNMLSLAGTADTALEHFLQKNRNIKEIHLRLNNDKAGILASESITEKYKDNYKTGIKYPETEDYNDLLCYINKAIENESQKQKDTSELESEDELEMEL